jgi:fused signal recognition particle receptor
MFSFFKKISSLGHRIRALFSRTVDESSYAELERLFYEADLGPITPGLIDKVRALLRKNPQIKTEELLAAIRLELLSIFPEPQSQKLAPAPHVILIVGVNGSGKTTTIAKLARHFRKEGHSVLLAAADTFRAASLEQLEKWAAETDADLIKSQPNGDPAAVVFDALAAAKSRGTDIVLIDTAGRLQTKTELMHELSKIRRICQKQVNGAPHETWLVLDATLGQNAIDQARVFHSFTPLTGIILAKLDGSAKGGIAAAIELELKIPIRWIGVGEGSTDLQPFDPTAYIDALLT